VSLLTIYRPNFCSECGAKIVRLRWYLWTSRKFCDPCTPKFRKEHWLQPVLVCAVFLLSGLLLGRTSRQEIRPLVINRPTASTAQGVNVSSDSGVKPVVSEDQVYMCGARTKKGTPCSRRVHGPTRCWQHKGMSAMRPQEKLLIKD